MPRTKGTDQKRFNPKASHAEKMAVATWGRFTQERYKEVLELVEGWTLRENLLASYPHPTPDQLLYLSERRKEIEEVTLSRVEDAVLRRDGEFFRKLADVVEFRGVGATPEAGLIQIYVEQAKTANPSHRFTFREIREWVADVKMIRPPFEESFEKRLRRLVKRLGVPIGKGQ